MSKKQILDRRYQNLLQEFEKRFANAFDVACRKIQTNLGEASIYFIDNVSRKDIISEHIVAPLMVTHLEKAELDYLAQKVVQVGTVDYVDTVEEAVQHILTGNTVIVFSFLPRMLYCETNYYAARKPEEPPTETAIKGSREGFVENLEDNLSMIRRRIRSNKLKFERMSIGRTSHTNVVISYIEGEAPESLLTYIRTRLQHMEVEYLVTSSYVEERLMERRTFLDTLGYTEKVDIGVAKLMEGRVMILVDNSPFIITAPHFFVEYFGVPDDYTLNKYTQNYFKLVRWSAFLIALLLPGIYLAVMTHHYKLIPTIFAFRLAVTRAGVPFPTVIEVTIMMFFFQLLREAGIRLPRPIGSALSIVGALILGDAAVGAGLTSQITVLIVALSSISLFLIPKLYGAIVLWSNIIILFSSVLGLPGFYIGFILFCSHVSGLTTCGYPYLYPLGTFKKKSFKDLIFRGDLREISDNIFKGGDQ